MSDELDYTNDQVKDCFKAFLVEGAYFTSTEQYPIIEEWMISKEIPDKIIPFDKIDEVDNIENYWICHYCSESSYAKVYNNPRKYINVYKKSKGIIGFDWSVHTDMPLITQKELINRNLSLTFFYAMRNIPIIPNIRYGNDKTTKSFYEALPKNSPVAIGTYGFIKSTKEKNVFKEFIHELIENLNPTYIIAYDFTNTIKGISRV